MENNTAHINRIIGNAGIKKGNSYKSGLKGQGYRSHEGYRVHNGVEGIVVNYTPATGNLRGELFNARYTAAMATITATLNAAGFALTASTIYPGAFVVKAGK